MSPAVPRALNVTLVLQCERWRFVRVGLAVPLVGTVAELREMVAREGHVPPEQVTGTREGTPLLGDTDSAVPQCWGRGRDILQGTPRCRPAGDPGRAVPAGVPALPG